MLEDSDYMMILSLITDKIMDYENSNLPDRYCSRKILELKNLYDKVNSMI